MKVFEFGINFGFIVTKSCDIIPTLAKGKQWVIVSLSRFMIGYLVKVRNISVYLLTHQSRAFDITSTTS